MRCSGTCGLLEEDRIQQCVPEVCFLLLLLLLLLEKTCTGIAVDLKIRGGGDESRRDRGVFTLSVLTKGELDGL